MSEPLIATQAELLAKLDAMGISTATTVHNAVFSVEESQHLRGQIAGAHTKNLFVKDKKGSLFLVTAKEDTTINLKHLHRHVGASGRVSFGSAESMMEVMGVTPGSVTAFGLINDHAKRLTFVLDEALSAHELVNAHPLINTATTTLTYMDLLVFARATGHEPLILPLGDL